MKVGVFGAGSIGCYLGGRLQCTGVPVVYVGRGSVLDELTQHGLRLTDHQGYNQHLAPADLTLGQESSALRGCDVVLVTVKGVGTAQAAQQLKPDLGEDSLVVSFQNGVRNPEILAAELGERALAAMVQFNVVRKGDGHFHHGTSGTLVVQRDARVEPLVTAFLRAGMDTHTHTDMRSVLWGKLLLNLNNSINALAGIPLKHQLEDRGYRTLFADCQDEALAALGKAGIHPETGVGVPAWMGPHVLRLPDMAFRIIAGRLVSIDPQARSSMWDDLSRGRPTEVDQLNGEVVRLAESAGLSAPVNSGIMRLIRAAEGKGAPCLSADEIRRRIAAPSA